jgi:hypothetical protein
MRDKKQYNNNNGKFFLYLRNGGMGPPFLTWALDGSE